MYSIGRVDVRLRRDGGDHAILEPGGRLGPIRRVGEQRVEPGLGHVGTCRVRHRSGQGGEPRGETPARLEGLGVAPRLEERVQRDLLRAVGGLWVVGPAASSATACTRPP